MPLGSLWYANMTYQPMDCMASIHKVWRLIMRSIVFTKCEVDQEQRSSDSKFQGRLDCQETLVYTRLEVLVHCIFRAHCFFSSFPKPHFNKSP
jgi:hypothetical protein